jgi:alcohol dehydrogenase (NADP+)
MTADDPRGFLACGGRRSTAYIYVARQYEMDLIICRRVYGVNIFLRLPNSLLSVKSTSQHIPEKMTVPTVRAYAAFSATGPLTATTIWLRDLRPRDVLIEIRYTGISHIDIHYARGEWREERYPLVPGHEITGIIVGVGWAVTKHVVGDRVGVGCMVDSCGQCANCRDGREQDCIEGCTLTYGCIDIDGQQTQGGYCTHIVVTQDFVLKVPDAIGLDEAAPLLCSGITAYSPLRRFGAGIGTKVAVVGLGGVGHLSVKLAHAMGAEVSVLSQSRKKQKDGLRLGADHYYATSEAGTFDKLAGSFNLILTTFSTETNLDAYLSLLATDGALVYLGLPAKPLSISAFSLANNRRSLTASLAGGISETQEMLDFCGEHHVGADIEGIRAEQINEAYDRMLASDVRYRFVIDIATLA